jgi:hypothetical protein
MCPVCSIHHKNCSVKRSTQVCENCIQTYGIRNKKGQTIHFGLRKVYGDDGDDGGDGDQEHKLFRYSFGKYDGEDEDDFTCYINKVPCYAIESMQKVVIIATIPIKG